MSGNDGGLRIAVYQVTADGERQDVVPKAQVDGEDYVPRYPVWPACACPLHHSQTPGPQAG